MISYDVRAVANWFLDHAAKTGKTLTAMKLQKLAYIAHGWHLAMTDAPLVHDAVEAWKWGPVFRSLYREFREFGSEPITDRAIAFDGSTLEEKTIRIDDYGDTTQMDLFLTNVFDIYGKFTAAQLSEITHRAGTPWQQMFAQMGNRILPYTVIPNDRIKQHYKTLLNERSGTSNNTTN